MSEYQAALFKFFDIEKASDFTFRKYRSVIGNTPVDYSQWLRDLVTAPEEFQHTVKLLKLLKKPYFRFVSPGVPEVMAKPTNRAHILGNLIMRFRPEDAAVFNAEPAPVDYTKHPLSPTAVRVLLALSRYPGGFYTRSVSLSIRRKLIGMGYAKLVDRDKYKDDQPKVIATPAGIEALRSIDLEDVLFGKTNIRKSKRRLRKEKPKKKSKG